MKKLLCLVLLILSISSCSNREYVFLLENSNKDKLDKLPVEVILDNKKVYKGKLKIVNYSPSFETFSQVTSNNVSILTVKIADKTFTYDILYPINKYVIISPFIKDNEVMCAINTSEKKFRLE